MILRVFVTGSNLTEEGSAAMLHLCILFSFCDKAALPFNKPSNIIKRNFLIDVVLND